MAKGQQRSNREAKKPKKDAPKVSQASLSPFAQGKSPPPPKPTGKK
jgi:hypothetical protein